MDNQEFQTNTQLEQIFGPQIELTQDSESIIDGNIEHEDPSQLYVMTVSAENDGVMFADIDAESSISSGLGQALENDEENVDTFNLKGFEKIAANTQFNQILGEMVLENIINGEQLDSHTVLSRAIEKYALNSADGKMGEDVEDLQEFLNLSKTRKELAKETGKAENTIDKRIEHLMKMLNVLTVKLKKLLNQYDEAKAKHGEDHEITKALKEQIKNVSYSIGFIMGYSIALVFRG